MTPRLPSALGPSDFPQAELCALRLDGEAYRLDDCVCPIDEPERTALRAEALAAILPPRLIVEQHSAAWLWGALPDPPLRHEVCADIGARTRPQNSRRLVIREVVISERELSRFGRLAVTTPVRTALDLARSTSRFGQREACAIAALMFLAGFDSVSCIDTMEGRKNLPNKRTARARLEGITPAQPEFTR